MSQMTDIQLLVTTEFLSQHINKIEMITIEENDDNSVLVHLDLIGHAHVEIGWTGREAWFNDMCLHRIDGPAVTSPSGSTYWFVNGKRQAPTLMSAESV